MGNGTLISSVVGKVQESVFKAVEREAMAAGLILFAERRADNRDYFRFHVTIGTPVSPWIAQKSYALMWVAGYLAAANRK